VIAYLSSRLERVELSGGTDMSASGKLDELYGHKFPKGFSPEGDFTWPAPLPVPPSPTKESEEKGGNDTRRKENAS
jgi:hypothetical protein